MLCKNKKIEAAEKMYGNYKITPQNFSAKPHFPSLLVQQLQLLHLDEHNPRLTVLNDEGDQMPMILAADVRQWLPKFSSHSSPEDE